MKKEKGKIIASFPSKKNQVFMVQGAESQWVEKIFADPIGYQTEKKMGELFAGTDLPVPCRISFDDGGLAIRYEYVKAYPVVDLIESADYALACDIILKICSWLDSFYRITREKTGQQYIWGDIHLRNLLYEEETGTVYGVDFEECRPGQIESDAGRIYVFLLHYDPAFTERKRQMAGLLKGRLKTLLNLDEELLEGEIVKETQELLRRRHPEGVKNENREDYENHAI
ncbi:hypothetical protein MASR2M70_09320 [Bacillota bacterium]